MRWSSSPENSASPGRTAELALVSGSAADLPGESTEPEAHPSALILDTTGELRQWYTAADVVVIGKSLRSTGGQNPVEVLAAGAALVMGPHMENFRVVVRNLLAHEAAVQVADDAELARELARLLGNQTDREHLAGNGRAIVDEHHGAAARTAEVVLALALGG